MPQSRVVFLVSLVCFALLANLLGPSFFWEVPNSHPPYLGFFAGGALVAEVGLLAIWSALGPQPIVQRLPLSFAGLVLGACAFFLGLQLPDQNSSFPLDAALVIGLAATVMFTGMQVPLLLVRSRDYRRIASRHSQICKPAEESLQFGIRYLLGWMAVVGFLLAVLRYSLPDTGISRSFISQLPSILFGMFLFVLLSTFTCLPCVWWALSNRPALTAGAWLAGVMLCGPPGVLAGLAMAYGPPPQVNEILLSIYAFAVGLAGTILAVLLGLRRLGFRLASGEQIWKD